MDRIQQEVIEAGAWLRQEREQRGGDNVCSQTLVAELAAQRAKAIGSRVKVHQQQISNIERSTPENYIGPKRGLPDWWRHVQWVVNSGELDNFLGQKQKVKAEAPQPTLGEELLIHTKDGELVGRIILEFARER